MSLSENLRRRRVAVLFAFLTGCGAASSLLAEEGTAQTLSDQKKLAIIAHGEHEIPRSQRTRRFAKEGSIDAVGRLVMVGKSVYFKTADQSYIPEDRRFPYPELFFELHVSETHAYQPLFDGEYLKNRVVNYRGPIRIQGNWAYEGAYHAFALVWVDKASRGKVAPDADWQTWLDQRQSAKPEAVNSSE